MFWSVHLWSSSNVAGLNLNTGIMDLACHAFTDHGYIHEIINDVFVPILGCLHVHIFYSKQVFIMVIFGLVVGTVYFQTSDKKTDGIQNRSVQCKGPDHSLP